MSRRDAIAMSDAEVLAFLNEERTLTCATIGPDAWPHLMPLWYVVRDGECWAWTYAKSQKVRNLERDARATLQVEAGEAYDQLRGVMFECDVAVERDPDKVADYGVALFERYAPGADGGLPDEVREMVLQQAQKRIGLRFVPTRTVSWDHSKLGGAY